MGKDKRKRESETDAEHKARKKLLKKQKRAAKEAAVRAEAEARAEAKAEQLGRPRTRSMDAAEMPNRVRTRSMDAAEGATSTKVEKKAKKAKKEKKDKKKDKSADKADKAAKKAAKKAARKAAQAKAKTDSNAKSDTGSKDAASSSSASASASNGTAPGPAAFVHYTEDPAVAAMPFDGEGSELAKWREENAISLWGSDCSFKPTLQFSQAGLPSTLMSALSKFDKPTPIQAQCWPILLSGRDLVGIAQTGSGKTLAFTIPALVHLLSVKERRSAAGMANGAVGPDMLVVAPTRELAMQSAVVIEEVGKACSIRSVCVYGGVPKHPQRAACRPGGGRGGGSGPVEVVVATPGRLHDLLDEGSVNLSQVSYLVLDEADRMLDLGFERNIKAIIGACAPFPDRQTAMFSATWPVEVEALATNYLKGNPIKVTIGSEDLAANKKITQVVEVVGEHDRDRLLLPLLKKYHGKGEKLLLFGLYKKECARLERMLQGRGFNCVAIHGDKSQEARSAALESFRSGEVPLLIATDVAARGLDIPKVEVVVNYSFPLTIEDYVHRIGRTGRGGKTGKAHTFFHVGDKSHAGELVLVLREAGCEVPEALLKFGTHVKKKEHGLYGAFGPKNGMDMTKKATKITFD